MRRSLEKEMMDLPGNPRELFQDDLRNLTLINRYLGNHANVIGAFNRLVGNDEKEFSLLDVGTGSADIPLLIARWAAAKKLRVRITALDSEPVSAQEAKKQADKQPNIRVLRGDASLPPFRGASFDYVMASQLLHHFSEDKIIALLQTWSMLARRAIVISDLVRHPIAYWGIRLGTPLFTRNVMTRTDGPLSVRRAFTIAEWRELFRRADIGPFQIRWVFPFRIRAILNVQ